MSNSVNYIMNQISHISAWLGISNSSGDIPSSSGNRQSDDIQSSVSDTALFPPKPDGWQSDESWFRFQELRAKYPNIFQDADQYINSFIPSDVEMIMANVSERYYYGLYTEKTVKYIKLFKHISETRRTLESATYNPEYLTLEYVMLNYSLETFPSQNHYKYKFIGDDTIYKC